MEIKLIAGIKHTRVRCTECKEMCWTQWPCSLLWRHHYKCRTCTELRNVSVGRGVAIAKEMDFDT